MTPIQANLGRCCFKGITTGGKLAALGLAVGIESQFWLNLLA